MEKINVFESKNRFEFKQVITLLSSENIEFEVLHEYRLFEEKDFGESTEGAIIRITRDYLLRTNQLLVSNGFIEVIEQEAFESKTIKKVTSIFDEIPVLKKMTRASRFVLIFFLLFTLPLIALFYSSFDWNAKELTGNHWCLNAMLVDGQEKMPRTVARLRIMTSCIESIRFSTDGKILLPGFNSPKVKANWIYSTNRDSIKIYDSDQFSEIYDGTYFLKWKPIDRKYILTSDRTVLTIKTKY